MRAADLFDVSGRVSVIVGAASAIALSCAQVLADNRASVSIIDADQALLDRLGRTPGLERVNLYCADVMQADALRRVLAQIEAASGPIDIAIIGAIPETAPGTDGAGQSVDMIDPSFWRRQVDAGLSAAYVGLGAIAPAMKARRRGSIIVTTPPPSNSLTGQPPSAALATIAAGTGHLVRQVALELAGSGVRVNSMAVASTGGSSEGEGTLSRFALPREIEALALYLASDASSYMTGVGLKMDGGAGLGVIGSRS